MTADPSGVSEARSLYVHDAGIWMSTPAGATEWSLAAPALLEALCGAADAPAHPLAIPDDTQIRRGVPTLFRVQGGRLTGWDHAAAAPFALTALDLAILDADLPTSAGELRARSGHVVERLVLLRSCGALDFDAEPRPAELVAPEPEPEPEPAPTAAVPEEDDEPVARWRMALWPAVRFVRQRQRERRQRRQAASSPTPAGAPAPDEEGPTGVD